MDADGCIGTHGGMGIAKPRQEGVTCDPAGQDLGPMVGEISPDIMFSGFCQKMIWMGADGYRAVQMGANGCIDKDGDKKSGKRTPNGQVGHWTHFCVCVSRQEMCDVHRDGCWSQRESKGGIEGEQGACGGT